MNEMTSVKGQAAAQQPETYQNAGGMDAASTAYMRAGAKLTPGSVPLTTSRYLNSPLFVHAYTTMSLRRMGDDVPTTYDVPDMSRGLADVTDHANGARLIAEEREKNPLFDAWVAARQPMEFDLEKLRAYAPGTLGEAIFAFVEKGYNIQFVHNFEARNDLEYVIKAIGRSHDLQHMVTGFGPSLAGEHSLAVMNIVSTPRFVSAELAHHLTLANSFVTAAQFSRVFFNYPAGTPLMMEATKLGILAGEAVKMPLFMVDFDSYLDWQLEDITRDLGFERGPGDAWDYSNQTMAG